MDEKIQKVVAKRIFMQGYLEGVKVHAVCKNGQELVGTMKTPFDKYADRMLHGDDAYFEQIWSSYLWNFQEKFKIVLV